MVWIRSLVTRAKRLCSPDKVKKEIDNIKRFASYNGFPKWIVNKEVKRCQELSKKEKKQCDEDITTLFMFLPYIGKESEYIVKRCKSYFVCLTPQRKSNLMYSSVLQNYPSLHQ